MIRFLSRHLSFYEKNSEEKNRAYEKGNEREKGRERERESARARVKERERENDAALCLGLFRTLCSFVQLKSPIGLLSLSIKNVRLLCCLAGQN